MNLPGDSKPNPNSENSGNHLIGDLVKLRIWTAEDAPRLTALLQAREIRDTNPFMPRNLSANQICAAIENEILAPEHQVSFRWAIEPHGLKEVVGCVSLDVYNDSRGEIGFWIGVPYWRRGYASEAARLVVKFGFESANCSAIEARALERNHASIRVLEKLGFQLDGALKDMEVYGRIRETIVMFKLLPK